MCFTSFSSGFIPSTLNDRIGNANIRFAERRRNYARLEAT
jgi:hypothetical protein